MSWWCSTGVVSSSSNGPISVVSAIPQTSSVSLSGVPSVDTTILHLITATSCSFGSFDAQLLMNSNAQTDVESAGWTTTYNRRKKKQVSHSQVQSHYALRPNRQGGQASGHATTCPSDSHD